MRAIAASRSLAAAARALWRVLALVLPITSCAPFHDVPGDVCNDPTQNYSKDFAYECNQSG